MIEKKITGIMVYYYYVCIRKLWYFSKGIQLESNDENVKMGKYIDKCSYNNEIKHINFDDVINIDYIEYQNIIHEVKKSKSIEEASIKQVQYYIWYLKNKGIHVKKGVINYPMIRKIVNVYLEDEDCKEIELAVTNIKKIISCDSIPGLEFKGICKACAYYDLCYL